MHHTYLILYQKWMFVRRLRRNTYQYIVDIYTNKSIEL